MSGVFFAASLALGVLATTLMLLLPQGPAWIWAWIAFAAVASLGLAPAIRKRIRGERMHASGFYAEVGEKAWVTEGLDPATGKGMVQFVAGPRWLASSDTAIPVNTWVEVVEVHGARLRVRPAPGPRSGVSS
jgi:membrane protein implicated in regulation of membrane protease activity